MQPTNVVTFPRAFKPLTFEEKQTLLARLRFLISKQPPKIKREWQRKLTDLMHDLLRAETKPKSSNPKLKAISHG